MSKLYSTLQNDISKEKTARGHRFVAANLKNWKYSIGIELRHKGGDGADEFTITMKEIGSGKSVTVLSGTMDELSNLIDPNR